MQYMLSGILVRIKTFTNFSVNSSVLTVVAASNIPIKEMYVSKPVLRPKEPQSCCPIGAPLKAKDTKSAIKREAIQILNKLGRERNPFRNSPNNIPKQERPTVARINTFIRFIGSYMTLGTIASVIAGATKRSSDASLCLDS